MPARSFEIAASAGFRLPTVAKSHGWYDLPPFRWSEEGQTLSTTMVSGDRAVDLAVSQPASDRLAVTATFAGRLSSSLESHVRRAVRAMLNLDLDPSAFFAAHRGEFAWAERLGAGRLLRSPTVFEDAVKTLATTNCSWLLTRLMLTRLVDSLGTAGPSGVKAFPTPEAMARTRISFYRDVMKAGYRAERFQAFARAVAAGCVDPESWADPARPTDEVMAEIRANPGFGPYAAENLGRILGRYDGLGLDSWCLKKFPMIHGPVRGDVSKAIRRHYAKHGQWQGLALWLDLTRDWHEETAEAKKSFKS